MNETQMHDRAREFRGPVEDAAIHNPVIYAIIQAYVHGRIVTREEALSQMVVQLSRDWREEQQRCFDMVMKNAGPGIIKP